jgi:phage terminase small subunit
MAGGLTDKQQRFVDEYLIDLNGAQAAIRTGYSARSAKEQAARLLTDDNIASAVASAMNKRATKAGINAQWVLDRSVEAHAKAAELNNLTAELAALKLIGQHIDVAAFEERVKRSGSVTVISVPAPTTARDL